MLKTKLLCNLSLFDGGAAAPAAGTEGAGAQGDTNGTVPGATRRGRRSGEYANVMFGKQEVATPAEDSTDANTTPAAGENKGAKAPDTLEDRRKAFEAMIDGEFKDVYTEKTQKLINARFKESKALEDANAKTQPLLDMLSQRYGISDGDVAKLQSAIEADDAFWESAAAAEGMETGQYREMMKVKIRNASLEKQNAAFLAEKQNAENKELANARVQKWLDEGEALKATFPDFSFDTETENPQFMRLLRSGISVEHAYRLIHQDEIVAAERADAEKRIVDNIRARGVTPIENGAVPQSAFTVKDDPTKLSKKDRAEIAKRARRGETISF